MQHELKSLEQRWGLALQSAAFGVWDLQPQAQRVLYSPEWKAMLGYGTSDEPDSTSVWRERVHPQDLQPMLQALNAHLQDSSTGYEAEFRLRAADGSFRWVLSRGRVVERGPGGEALRMVGTLTDLTDRRELDEARRARDIAEAASQAKTGFLSRMSHELRTPLNAILGFAQLLTARLGDGRLDEQRSQLAHIEQAGWHLLSMINDVLDLARVESGQLTVTSEPVAVASLWRFVSDMMGPEAARHRTTLQANALPAGAAVVADPVRLRQVFINLLSNAIKYNRDGGLVVFDAQADGAAWRLSISDTGQGLSQDDLARLFEPFNRLSHAHSGIDGVGIGLVLSRWLVHRMGGSLSVRSTLGVGSVFEVVLPAAVLPVG